MKKLVLTAFLALSTSINAQITDTGDRVGIGTNSPSRKLEVAGDILVKGDYGMLGRFVTTSNAYAEISLQNQSGPNNTPVQAQFKVESGRVEIGSRTVNPVHFGAGDNKSHLIIQPNGNVGIGTTMPKKKLHVAGNIKVDGDYGFLGDFSTTSNTWAEISLQNLSGPNNTPVQAQFKVQKGRVEIGSRTVNPVHFGAGDNKSHLIIQPNGSIGVGTTIPDEKFTVKGNIHAEEVRVDLSVPAPDYVFEKKYGLTSLEELEKYIQTNKHLPEVPAAIDFEKEGISVGEMNMLLLKKVEELTLHLIDQNKQIKYLLKENKKLHKIESKHSREN